MCKGNEFKDECKLAYRCLWMNGQIFREERERGGECEKENKGLFNKSRHQGLNGKRRLVQNSILNTVLTVTAVVYSGAKKYLVSHQLCKFSHLKR